MSRFLFILCLLQFGCIHLPAQETGLQGDLSLKYLVQMPAIKSAHAPVIILLHGYGSDERDLFELRNAFPKNYIVIAARAPYNVAGAGYEWYEGMKGQHDGDKAQLNKSRQVIDQFVTEIVARYKADARSVYLMGFSQGAIMSYEVGLTDPAKIKGIGVLSGMIFESLKPEIKKSAALKQLKIFISHGTADERIPFAMGKASFEYLTSLGLKPDFHQYPGMGHAISNDVLTDLVKWFK